MYVLITIDDDNITISLKDEAGADIGSAEVLAHDLYAINPRTLDNRVNIHKRREVGSEGNYSDPPYRSFPSEITVVYNDTAFTTESQPLPDPPEEEEEG